MHQTCPVVSSIYVIIFKHAVHKFSHLYDVGPLITLDKESLSELNKIEI